MRVDNTDIRNELGENIRARGGLMTPEHVAEGFFRLLTQCDNGSAMAVNKVSKAHCGNLTGTLSIY